MIQQFNSMVEKYVWAGHKPKIKLEVLQLSRKNGGANLVDIRRRDIAIKTVWVKDVVVGTYNSEFVYNIIHPGIRGWIWLCSSEEADVPCIGCKSMFWNDVLKAWCKYHYDERSEVKNQIICTNTEK